MQVSGLSTEWLWGASQPRNAKRERGPGGREGRVRIVFRPILCDRLIPGVMPFVCVTQDARNKHLKLFRAWGWCGAPGIQKAFVL